MKLEAERVSTPGESLIAAFLSRCEQSRRFGQLEGIAVPVKHRGIVLAQVANHRLASRGTEGDLAPSNFFESCRINARAQRPRHQLRPETYSDRRPIRAQPHFEQVQLIFERRIEIIVVCADRPAEHD